MQLLFELVASFSMIPLYIKDGNLLPATLFTMAFYFFMTSKDIIPFTPFETINQILQGFIYVGMAILLSLYAISAPERYPDLHSVLISAFSFGVFLLYYLMVLRLQYSEVVSKPKNEWFPFLVLIFVYHCFFVFSQNRKSYHMFAIRSASKIPFVSNKLFGSTLCIAKRLFAEASIVKIVSDDTVKVIATEAPAAAETKKTDEKVNNKQNKSSEKKKSSFRPFLYGCTFTAIAGYFFLYKQIWKSANQMEQALADISVDIAEKQDKLEQRLNRVEAKMGGQ